MADYVTASEVGLACGINDATDNLALQRAATAASRQVEYHCGRRFWQDSTVATREFYAESPRCCDLLNQPGTDPKVEISTTSGLIVKIDEDGDGTFETTLTIDTDFILLPRNAEDDSRPYSEIWLADNYYFPRLTNGRAGVQATAKFGWATTPEEVDQATLAQAVYLFKSPDAPFGAAEIGGGAIFLRNAPLHPSAKGLLMGLQRPTIG